MTDRQVTLFEAWKKVGFRIGQNAALFQNDFEWLKRDGLTQEEIKRSLEEFRVRAAEELVVLKHLIKESDKFLAEQGA